LSAFEVESLVTRVIGKMTDSSNHEELNKRKWDRRAKIYDQKKRSGWLRFVQKRVTASLPLTEGVRFVDIGCGTGWAVYRVAEMADQRGEFYGVDLSTKMLEKAEENCAGLEHIHFLKANAESIPLEDDYFDIALCTNSFHHYLNPLEALGEFHRILKDGGRLFIMEITADSRLMRLIDKKVAEKEPEHVRFYSTEEYREMYRAAGLEYVTSKVIAYPVKVHIAEKV
jgi:ubiquinone/menaquinone biosynthesis C-methylase UbiE